MNIETVKAFIKEPYAWPGGYERVLIMDDGACLCHKCAAENLPEIERAIADGWCDSGWLPLGVDIIWEGGETCAHCYRPVSVYGDPDDE